MTMTNNPTIDGVSREYLKRWRRDLDACQRVIWLAGGFDPAYCMDAQECIAQMDSVLDAPAVERQDPYRVLVWWSATGARKPDWNPSLWGSINEAIQYHGAEGQITKEQAEQQGDWLSGGQWFSVPLYEAAPEVAALQSTIAQLQARVQELESGRGEPVANCFERRNGAGEWINDTKVWLDGVPCEGILKECEKYPDLYRIRLAYAAPPAPVAAVLPNGWQDTLLEEMERRFALRKMIDDDHMVNDDTQVGVEFAIEWIESCLDATAALNKP